MTAFVVDRLVTDAAARTPAAAAVRFGDTTWSYAELDRAADGVAAALCDAGVALGDRVAVWLDKSPETIATLYGIQRAGAVFVPLDPKAPDGRMAAIIADAAPSAVVADAKRLARMRAACHEVVAGARTLVAGDSLDAAITSGAAPPDRAVTERDLAYILYTSGSTGTPKGVMIRHANALAFVRWAADAVGLRGDDVCSQHAALNFDLSTFDLYAAALAGACCAVVDPVTAMFPVKLAEWIRTADISVWYSVPSALIQLLQRGRLGEQPLPSLRTVIFAGEVFPPAYLAALMQAIPHAAYWNFYGPTETNVCTAERVDTAPAGDGVPVAIGAACGSCRGRVVGADGNEVRGTGAEGELWITGGTVAAGYWADPERSARGFCAPDTYRTGDIVRILDDTPRPRYAFVGRTDDMVKTRGYRVELGEVEVGLRSAACVGDAVAVAVPDDVIGARIVAFCTAAADRGLPASPTPTGASIDAFVAETLAAARTRLPPYMLPDKVIVLEELPRTANGKIDRAALRIRAERHESRHADSIELPLAEADAGGTQ